MGVHGLWKLLEPAGKPVPLESLENKVLAVDVSIWLYQLTTGLQTTGGGAVPNAHILGLFNRICKLLYYRIKPVFVFDGGVPLLKRETIEARKRQKLKTKESSEQLREKLLNNWLRQKVVNQLLGDKDSPSTSSVQTENDLFILPPLPEEVEDELKQSEDEDDPDMSSAKVESFCDYQYGKDVNHIDVTSEQFKSLPPEIRHEILSELIESKKQNSWHQIHEMPEESNDFSVYQMKRLIKRRNVQRSLDEAAKEMGGRMMTLGELEDMFRQDGIVTDALSGKRIAKDDVTRFIYISGKKSEETKPEQMSSAAKPNSSPVASTSPEKPPAKKHEVDEREFCQNVYEIDKCVFVNDSSSEDEDKPHEDGDADGYARLLSQQEKLSQMEILELIKGQAIKKTTLKSPQPSTSRQLFAEKATTREQTDFSDIEDEPDEMDVIVMTQGSVSLANSEEETLIAEAPLIDEVTQAVTDCQQSCQSEELFAVDKESGIAESQQSCQSEELFLVEEDSKFAKSMSKLGKMISAITGNSSSMETAKETSEDKKSSLVIELDSESDSDDDFIEVTDSEETQLCPYFKGEKDEKIEITIDRKDNIEDDIFADVFHSPNEDEFKEGKIQSTNEIGSSTSAVERKEKLPVMAEKRVAEPQKKEDRIKKLVGMVEKAKEVINERKSNTEVKAATMPRVVPRAASPPEELLNVQKMLQEEASELQSERVKKDRIGSTITQQMMIEAQELLQLFGLPYITAPMEAEAQCAFLDQASLTDGTITDDSDIWLFGGQKVYKNFFDNRKYVLQFRNVDIEHFFNLSREQLIQMALLVGSDYTVGIEGIGPVTAIEILAYFSDKANKPESEADIAETLRKFKLWIENNRKGVSALTKKVRNVSLSENFPSMHVIEAYLYPTVDESKERFTWSTPDLDRVRTYMKTKFGWKTSRIDDILLPVMKRLSGRDKQTTLDAFFKAKPYTAIDTANVSQRVMQAIKIMKNKVDVDVTALPTKSPRKKNAKRPEASPKGKQGSRKKQPMGQGCRNIAEMLSPQKAKSESASQEVIPQREKDRLEATKRKLEAVKIFKASQRSRCGKRGRGGRSAKMFNVLPPRADSSYLSESSSDSG